MRWTTIVNFAVLTTLALISTARPARAQLWKQFVPVSHVVEVPQRDATLAQDCGPWLIMTAAFQGENAEQQARALADELRGAGLAAYVHDRTFDFSEKNPGRGLDQFGAPVRKRYQHETDHQWAVLVGDFVSLDEPQAQETLERVKSMPSKTLSANASEDSGFGQVKQFSTSVIDKLGRRKERGPMQKAFFTRNPLLPREYFVPKGIDEFVVKMNENVEHSLLDCPGRYTLQVATFRGQTILETSTTKNETSSPFGFKWKKDRDNPLIEAAENAHLLAATLREHGYDAYEFHDRTESIVTIGAFEQVAQQAPNGQIVPTPDVQQLIVRFGAVYDTPSDPLTGDDIRRARQAEELKQQFTQMLSGHDGQVAAGLNPKHVKIMRGKKVDRIIPIDVYPHTIEVPRRSISGDYAQPRQ